MPKNQKNQKAQKSQKSQKKKPVSPYDTVIIKRYQNRKLYDTNQSRYVTLEDIADMIRDDDTISVIDNKTKKDITEATLVQIVFDSERKAAQYAPLATLRDIIRSGNGSFSSYLHKLGVFSTSGSAEDSAEGEDSMNATLSESLSFEAADAPTNLPHSATRPNPNTTDSTRV